ncbi:hypothetical protein OSC52_06750 [Clostridium pasteurianum]|nr:hypothetical protein [Clostridium pasteurianum]UZW15532.1 hypothetical protein OSC52_06750 [Clostridium pasteurianum]
MRSSGKGRRSRQSIKFKEQISNVEKLRPFLLRCKNKYDEYKFVLVT